MERREFLLAGGGALGLALAGLGAGNGTSHAAAPARGDTTPPGPSDDRHVENGLAWYNVRHWHVEGRAWRDTERAFDRLPARAKKTVRPPVWNLSRHSAGMAVRFETDAAAVSARWTLLSKSLAMPHMPATGVSGLDLYARDDAGRWRWVANGRPSRQTNTARLVAGLPKARRAYLLYLPLYNGVESLEVGVAPTAMLRPLPPRTTKPMVFYGTSILQGGCASRPGMVHTAILGRRLDRAVVNFGFSGNGTMDASMADLMAELDPCVYVVDCLPNMAAAAVAQRTEPFVRTLRKARPTTPIVLVEDRSYAGSWIHAGRRRRNLASRAALRDATKRLRAAGVGHLHYVEGDGLFGDDDEATVDGSHPTDLGFVRMADALEPVLRPLVAAKAPKG